MDVNNRIVANAGDKVIQKHHYYFGTIFSRGLFSHRASRILNIKERNWIERMA
ncbi:hypothetical protein [Dysgonomonas alginatilytica]|uniref:hypothetical protein n=1 Tax=Dysgonomonas alginatilytica TaxID=1605892 RepID=UPI001FE6835C|nr:hypothetical protein [Dysgonomonas alginatilytica]